MIKITRYQNKWRIRIEEEEWEFEDQFDFRNTLEFLIKEKEGKEVYKNETKNR